MAKVYLIRHGQASAGSTNYDVLSPKGIEQANILGQHFSKYELHVDRVIAGPLERQKDSAKHFSEAKGHRSAFDISQGYKEHDGYKMFKKHFQQLSKLDPVIQDLMAKSQATDRPQAIYFQLYEHISTKWVTGDLNIDDSEIENWKEFEERVIDTWEDSCRQMNNGEQVAIFSSAGPVSLIVGHELGLTPTKTLELSWIVHNASVTEITFKPNGKRSLTLFNNIAHFHGRKEMITLV